nr:FMN-binding protein [Oscillospiraceae bacterium]
MERNRTANLIAMIVAAILMVVLIVGHVRANQSQIFRMPEDGQLLTASVQGRNGPVEVEVAAGPTAFYRVKILSHEETEGIGTLAVDAIPNTIMETQRLDFDAVSGATITSEAIRSAVASALESGGIDPAAFGYVAPTPAPEKEETPKPAPAPAAAAGGNYVPGTYTAEATGMGTVKVSVTVDENAITEVVLDTAGETPEIGGAATEELTSQVMAAQGPAIDGVSGATLTSNAVSTAVADALAQAAAAPAENETAGTEPASEPEETAEPEAAEPETAAAAAADVPDGAQTLKGSGLGKVGDVDVEVVADENTIYSITVVEYEETPGIGTLAVDQIPAAIVEAQSLQVDAVAGATITTDAIKKAVAAALVSGGIDASKFEKAVEAAAPEAADVPDDARTLKGSGLGKVGDVDVEVVADENTIYSITVVKHDETPGIGTVAVDQIPAAIVEAQSLQVDAIAGATMTTDAIKEAVAAALVSGGIDASRFEKAVEAAAAPESAGGGAYVPGTYTAEATGMGTVKVSVTVDENAITGVVLDTAGETPAIGGAAAEELTSQVMAAQGAGIDGVSGATITSDAVRKAVADALAQAAAPAASETEGTEPAAEPETAAAAVDAPGGAQTLIGTADGRNGPVEVEVVMDGDEIVSVAVTSHSETDGIGTAAVDQIPAAIVEQQSILLDAVSGATVTSEAILNAVAAALEVGGLDPADFELAAEAAEEP